jgi:hypothetical protein
MRLSTRPRALFGVLLALACDGGLEPRPAPTSCPAGFVGVCGTLHIRGAIPDSTEVVYVVAYPVFPRSRGDLFDFRPLLPPTVPYNDSTYYYTLPLSDGRYEWVLAVWKKRGTLTIQNADSLLREAGYFHDRADPTRPGVVIVNGTGTDSIDFVVDFSNMHPVSYYFPLAVKQ